MTRDETIKQHLPMIALFLRATVRDWEAGLPIRKRATPNDIKEELPWVVRRYVADQYNRLVEHMMDLEARNSNRFEVRKKHGGDQSLLAVKSKKQLIGGLVYPKLN